MGIKVSGSSGGTTGDYALLIVKVLLLAIALFVAIFILPTAIILMILNGM